MIIDDDPSADFLAYDFDSGLPENNSLAITGVESDLGFGPHEALSAIGDSGGPTFINGAIAGITASGYRLPRSDVNDWLDNSWGEIALDVRVSTFRDFIHGSTDGAARFVVDGDYDQNGIVDDGDWLTWKQQFGATEFLSADGNGDGIVDAADFVVWRDNLGASTESTPVPEPATSIILLLATVSVCRRGRLKQHRVSKLISA